MARKTHNKELIDLGIQARLRNLSYDRLVSYLIRQRYTLDQEFALLRQRDEKPQEYQEYYEYAEECKRKAKEIKGN